MTEEQQQGLYVYGVVRADADLGSLGGGGNGTPDIELVEADDLAAIITAAGGEDEAAVRDSVLAHARVLERATETATVVPLRFGMVSPDEETVAKELDERHDQLLSLLDKLEGHVQMTLKVHYDDSAVLREIIGGSEELRRLREAIKEGSEEETYDARVRLGELVNNAVEQRRQEDGQEILQRIEPLIVSSVTEPPEKEFMVLNAPLLVERSRLSELNDALEEIAQARQDLMHFRLLGPMPAYHFVSGEEPAWA
jgi:Gas vesicle synthesis protein GvpL/GvpF